MRPRSPVFAALATMIAFGLAGCGQAPAMQSPAREQGLSVTTEVPRTDPTARWADGYCGAVSKLVQALATLPTVDPRTPQQASRTSSDLLSSLVGGLDLAMAGLDSLGAPPLAAADQGRQDVIGQFAQIRSQADEIRQRIDAVQGDSAATKDALGQARTALDRVAELDVLKGLKDVPALEAAGERAPSCQDLTRPPR